MQQQLVDLTCQHITAAQAYHRVQTQPQQAQPLHPSKHQPWMLQQINYYVLLQTAQLLKCVCVWCQAGKDIGDTAACLPALPKYSLATVPGCITPSANAYALQLSALSHTPH